MPLSPARSAEGRVRYRGAVPQGPELIIILVVILLLFGGAKLPKLARSLGQAQNEFKKGVKEDSPEDDEPTV
jgi:TatA/E family protein of Tat protein translocase